MNISKEKATFIGFSAILMWSVLALLTAGSGQVPPFQLSAMAFCVGAIVGVFALIIRRVPRDKVLEQMWAEPKAMLVGVLGLFGYHFLYFTALRNVPEVEAGLIAYLWPLLIVLGSALMPGERLRLHHILGALAGAIGALLIVTKGQGFTFDPQYAFGYGMAFLCSFTWTAYSLLSRRFPKVPTDAVTLFCAAAALLSLMCHLVLEDTIWPQTLWQWFCVLGLGLLPLGAAFYTWDFGVKHGDIQVLGALSYAAPLLSTIILILAGAAQLSWVIAVACLLITFGGMIAAKDMILKKSP